MSKEIDYLMRLGIDGVNVVDESESIVARVSEWLDTPQGQIWGSPHWGNRLGQYKHEPMNSNTEAAIENSIVLTLPIDVRDAVISGVLVEQSPNDIDTYMVTVVVNGQVVKKGITL